MRQKIDGKTETGKMNKSISNEIERLKDRARKKETIKNKREKVNEKEHIDIHQKNK